MRRIVIGTAGHVDHGKTTLTRALTGCETDRLAEEKSRGISIQLGFAPLPISDNMVAGIVDVPGHEKFIKTMLAGVAGIDMVLLVIAADEGIMPQTQEHLDILTLLGVERGILVLNKADMVDEEWLEMVEEEVRQAVKDTPLADAPLLRVSAVTGQGIPELKAAITQMALAIPARPAAGQARLPIDRSFSSTGFGTVVTGTLWSGHLNLGDTVELWPGGTPARIRTLQVHNEKVDAANAGQRVAINLAGVEVAQAPRGGWLAASHLLSPSYRLDVELQLLKSAKAQGQRSRIRLHHGTAEILGRIQLLDREELAPGESCFAQIALEEPITALRGDRFVIRSYSPMVTIGGGKIIEGQAARHKRYREEVLEEMAVKAAGSPAELFMAALHSTAPYLLNGKEALSAAGLTENDFAACQEEVLAKGEVLQIEGDLWLAKDKEEAFFQQVTQALADYHKQYMLRPGMPKEELRTRFFGEIPLKPFQQLLRHWENQGKLQLTEQTAALPDFTPTATPELLAWQEKALARLTAEPFAPPAWSELTAMLPPSLQGEAYLWLAGAGKVLRIAEDMVWSTQAVADAKAKIKTYIEQNGSVTLAAVRDLLQTSRKYALPFLEYLDASKFTKRRGEERILF